jgi:MSHA biogenesis protein MshO
MRPIRRSARYLGLSGFTLLEMIVTITIVAVIFGATLFFAYPMQQAGDVTTRAELTDMADNALQRIGRDVRLALPNSVRQTTTGTAPNIVYYVELVPLRTGARYRVESNGACSGGGTNELAFNATDGCFRSIGPIPDAATVTTSDFLVLNNYGEGFTGQSAYEPASTNRRRIAAGTSGTTVVYTPTTAFDRTLHDSPGRRFYVVTTPVSYVCDPGAQTLTRYSGYGFSAISVSQPTTFGVGASSALIATGVSSCTFNYSPNVAPKIGLLTLQLTLSRTVSTGTENVSLYYAVHVNNIP